MKTTAILFGFGALMLWGSAAHAGDEPDLFGGRATFNLYSGRGRNVKGVARFLPSGAMAIGLKNSWGGKDDGAKVIYNVKTGRVVMEAQATAYDFVMNTRETEKVSRTGRYEATLSPNLPPSKVVEQLRLHEPNVWEQIARGEARPTRVVSTKLGSIDGPSELRLMTKTPATLAAVTAPATKPAPPLTRPKPVGSFLGRLIRGFAPVWR